MRWLPYSFSRYLRTFFQEVRRDRGRVAPRQQPQRLGLGRLRLLAADVLLLGHAVEHVVPAQQRALRVLDRALADRALRGASDEGRLLERQVLHRLAVQEAAGRLDAVVAVPEVDLVAVEGEDLLLREVLLDLEGEDDLLDLALGGLLRREEQQPRELHRERREALAVAAGAQVGDRRPRHPPRVDPDVLPEVGVLDGHDGVAEHRRDVAELDHHALLDRELADHAAIVREHLRDDVRLELLERGDLGQVALEGQEDTEHGSAEDGGGEKGGHDDPAQRQDARRRRGRRHQP
jgi:hypothetical protein